ncbi:MULTISPECIES: hypothetical protein [Streptomyces]|uniref:hypothetical protein n=1 Tax=Streptomyces TaxID=1883 RepID=UPI00163C9548|nr:MULTISPECIES: hypothetical protein [Streptomyces]MBC2873502.1 hypothetical protein [Streptomyces sp. TYQ1024]UBI36808.1 hypothetical protein K7I03_10265 [Streptomyces mobaraensis]UKW29400.1 hypothetical protein MCU78_10240 [Streptomyces sp. TYQ1024]
MSGRLVRCCCALALAAAVVSAAPPPGGPAEPPSGERSVGALLTRLRTLYRQIDAATKEYEAAGPALRRQRAAADRAAEEVAGARVALARSRDEAGALAREQYRSGAGALSPAVTLLFAADPEGVLRRRHELERAAAGRAGVLSRLSAAAARADGVAREARGVLDAQLTLADRRERRRETARRGLDEVERLLAGLTDGELAALGASPGGVPRSLPQRGHPHFTVSSRAAPRTP